MAKYGCNICPAAPEPVAPTSLELNDGPSQTLRRRRLPLLRRPFPRSTATKDGVLLSRLSSARFASPRRWLHDGARPLPRVLFRGRPSPRSLLFLSAPPIGPSSTRPRRPCSRPSRPAATRRMSTATAIARPASPNPRYPNNPLPRHAVSRPGASSYERGITALLACGPLPANTHRGKTYRAGVLGGQKATTVRPPRCAMDAAMDRSDSTPAPAADAARDSLRDQNSRRAAACLVCRRSKIKCEKGRAHNDDRCHRCLQLGVQCVRPDFHVGRRKGVKKCAITAPPAPLLLLPRSPLSVPLYLPNTKAC